MREVVASSVAQLMRFPVCLASSKWFAKPDVDLRGPSASPLSLFRTFIPPSLRSKRLEMVYKAVVFDM